MYKRQVEYRCAIFEDVYRFPGLCERVQELLDKIDFLRSYGSFLKENEEASSPVSYTHLDVYKRQSPSCLASLIR